MIELIVADITTLDVDAIVNAANSALCGGGGVDGAIHDAAGPQLLEACRKLGGCPTGSAALTAGFQLKANFIIHSVGPVWQGGGKGEGELLAQTYTSTLHIAQAHPKISSIAFPSISTGAYRFPLSLASEIALKAMQVSQLDRVIACLFNRSDLRIYEHTARKLKIRVATEG